MEGVHCSYPCKSIKPMRVVPYSKAQCTPETDTPIYEIQTIHQDFGHFLYTGIFRTLATLY